MQRQRSSRLGGHARRLQRDAKCSGGPLVPVCKGGCPKRAMERDAGFMQETCDYWDHNDRLIAAD